MSNIVAAAPDLVVSGYSLERECGNVRIMRCDAARPPVRQWQEHQLIIVAAKQRAGVALGARTGHT